MKNSLPRFAAVYLAIPVVLAWVGSAAAAPIDDLIAGAKKEGVIDFYGTSTLGPDGAQAIVSAFNTKYGLDLTGKLSPSGTTTGHTPRANRL